MLQDCQDPIEYKAIETMGLPLFFVLAQEVTGDDTLAGKIYQLVLLEAKYILYLDFYHEGKGVENKNLADQFHNELLFQLKKNQREELLSLEKNLFYFWDLERELAKKMFVKQVTFQEVEEYTLLQSTDVFLYIQILSFFCKFPNHLYETLYLAQVQRDFGDDQRDLQEDFEEGMPNPLLLRLWEKGITPKESRLTFLQTEVTRFGVLEEQSIFLKRVGLSSLKGKVSLPFLP